RRIVTAAAAAAETLPRETKAQRLVLLGQTCEIRGDRALARRYFEQAAEIEPALARKAADSAAADADWPVAAQLYSKASKASATDPAAMFLYGHALAKAGSLETGKEQMRLASLAALAPEIRLPFGASLADHGLKEEGGEQFQLVRCTAVADSPA